MNLPVLVWCSIIALTVVTIASIWLRSQIVAGHYDGAAAVAGWFVAVVGFSITIWQLRQTQSAADAARRAAKGVESAIHKYDTITEIATAQGALRSTVEHHREKNWLALHAEYEKIQHAYTNIRVMHAGLRPDEEEQLKANAEQISKMEEQVERHVAGGAAEPDGGEFNVVVFKQLNDLATISAGVKKALGADANG